MGALTGIEWTDRTWNPVTGCTKVSPGCKNCYAKVVAGRGIGSFTGGRKFEDVRSHEDRLDQPLRWRKPQRVFVNSMSDLFHDAVSDAFLDHVFAVMALAPRHTFQVLTKRPQRMQRYVGRAQNREHVLGRAWEMLGRLPRYRHDDVTHRPWPLPNVWLGVSCEDQKRADERVPLLLQTPAAVRFLSCEPLLGPIDLEHLQPGDPPTEINALAGTHGVLRPHRGTCDRVDWVIAGGESGPGARPCDVAWIRSLVVQCRAAGVAPFVKQLGAMVGDETLEDGSGFVPFGSDPIRYLRRRRTCDRKGGDPAEWPEDLRIREFPSARPGQGVELLGEVVQQFPGGALPREDVEPGGRGG